MNREARSAAASSDAGKPPRLDSADPRVEGATVFAVLLQSPALAAYAAAGLASEGLDRALKAKERDSDAGCSRSRENPSGGFLARSWSRCIRRGPPGAPMSPHMAVRSRVNN